MLLLGVSAFILVSAPVASGPELNQTPPRSDSDLPGPSKTFTAQKSPTIELESNSYRSERYLRFEILNLKFSLGLPVKPGCDPDKLDACGSELVIFGTGQRIPETREQLAMQCRIEREAEICAREFAKECLPPLPRGMVIVILEGISQEVTWKCDANHSLHQAFLKHAPCMNKIGATLHKCMTNLTSKLDFSAGVEPHQRVSRSCCNFQEYISCSHRAVEKSCGKEAGEYIRKLLTRSAGDFIEIACVSHKTDAPACKKINSLNPNQLSNRIGQLNEVNSNRSMSLLSPLAKLVTAEG